MAYSGPKLRDHSLRFNRHLTSDYDEVDNVVSIIFLRIQTLRRFYGVRISRPEDVIAHIKVLVLNAFSSWCNYPFIYRAISKRAPDYSKPLNRYRKVRLSAEHVKEVMKDLEQFGLIEVHKGQFFKNKKTGYLTRYCATPVLIELMELWGVELHMLRYISIEPIRMRDEEKNFIDYEETPAVRTMRSNLKIINSAIQKKKIHIGFTDAERTEFLDGLSKRKARAAFDLNATTMYRVFNDSTWEHGGRFYGAWWTNLPKEARPFIRIDNKETVEVDYSGLHVRMLYAMEKLKCPADPYDLDRDEFPRDHQKTAIMTMINAKSPKKVLKSLARREDPIPNAKKLCAVLNERHKAIAKHFYSGIGSYLQSIDSKMAETVMLRIIRLGGVALPIHDSFIVVGSREADLNSEMNAAFNRFFQGTKSKQKAKPTVQAKLRDKTLKLEGKVGVEDVDFEEFSFFDDIPLEELLKEESERSQMVIAKPPIASS